MRGYNNAVPRFLITLGLVLSLAVLGVTTVVFSWGITVGRRYGREVDFHLAGSTWLHLDGGVHFREAGVIRFGIPSYVVFGIIVGSAYITVQLWKKRRACRYESRGFTLEKSN